MIADDQVTISRSIDKYKATIKVAHIRSIARTQQNRLKLKLADWLTDSDRHLVTPVPDASL